MRLSGKSFPHDMSCFFPFKVLQGVSDRGKKQQNAGCVGPPVAPWAGGGILPSTAGMPVVTNASHPAAWDRAHPMITSFLKHLVVTEKSKPKTQAGAYFARLLYRKAAMQSKVKKKYCRSPF